MEYFGNNPFLAKLDEEYYKFENKIIRHNCYEVKAMLFQDTRYFEEFTILHGLKNGKYINCYNDGGIEFKCKYIKDKKEGEGLRYHKNGNIKSECNYINNKWEGKCVNYDENGNIKVICNYVNDELEGESIEYHKNGNIRIKSDYVKGTVVNKIQYDLDCTLISRYYFNECSAAYICCTMKMEI